MYLKIDHIQVAVLTASLVSGLTKAWLGTQNNGAKEVSFSDHTHSGYASSSHNHDSVYSKLGHTHTASQINGISTFVVKTQSEFSSSGNSRYTTITSGSKGYIAYGGDGSNGSGRDWYIEFGVPNDRYTYRWLITVGGSGSKVSSTYKTTTTQLFFDFSPWLLILFY